MRRPCAASQSVSCCAASGLLSDIGFQGPELRFEPLTRAAPGQPSRALLRGPGCATVAPSHGLRPRTQGTASPRSHSRSRAPQPLFATPLHESFAMSTLRPRNQACGTALRACSLRRLGWTTSLRTPPGEASTPSRSWIARCQDSACVALCARACGGGSDAVPVRSRGSGGRPPGRSASRRCATAARRPSRRCGCAGRGPRDGSPRCPPAAAASRPPPSRCGPCRARRPPRAARPGPSAWPAACRPRRRCRPGPWSGARSRWRPAPGPA